MARGFESKDVEFQQAEAERQKPVGRALTSEERERLTRRRTLELSLIRTRAERDAARSPAHRRMLDQAVEELELQIQRIK